MSWYKEKEDELRDEYNKQPIFMIKTNGLNNKEDDSYFAPNNAAVYLVANVSGQHVSKIRMIVSYMDRKVESDIPDNYGIEQYKSKAKELITKICKDYRISEGDFDKAYAIFVRDHFIKSDKSNDKYGFGHPITIAFNEPWSKDYE